MNKHIELGVINSLKVNRISEPGIYLICEDEEEVLLPNCYITKEMELDTLLDVFVYTDSEDRLVSTTLTPYVKKDEFAALEVVDRAAFGAFVDIGLPKDILVPKNKQKSTFNVGDIKVIKIIEDENTGRLIGTEKFNLQEAKGFERNQEVEILVYTKTPLGFKVVVNNTYEGLIYHSEIFQKINIGDKKRAYTKSSRDDGKLDISLQRIGQKDSDENSTKVLEVLRINDGEINFTYKSDAEDIKTIFSMSKKVYKATLTKLINEKKIILGDSSIKINKD